MKRMSVFTVILVCVTALLLSNAAQAVTVNAAQGKTIQYKNDTGVWIAEDRLATRTAGVWGEDTTSNTLDAKKAYLQFDLRDLFAANPGAQGGILSATLTLTACSNSGGKPYNVSGLKDSINETWSYTTIDWFSAPGNLTTSGSALIADQTTSLYAVAAGSVVANMPNTGDVTTFVNTDTDGLVTFIFTAGGTAYMYNSIAGSNYNAAYVPVLDIVVPEPATLLLLGLGGLILKRR